MKSKIPVVLILSILTVAVALAQTSTNTTSTAPTTSTPAILGSGTPNFIPQFTGRRTLGNSNVFQAGNSVGVNTTSPQATLDVESTDIFGILGVTSSTAPFAAGVLGRSASPTGNAVVGEATATSGTNNGVFGRSASTNGIGVSGDATAASGVTAGVFGNSDSESGAGVKGNASASSGFTYGVFGRSNSTTGSGVFGYASATSGSPNAMVGFTESPNAVAGQFVAHSGLGLILQGLSGSNQTQVFFVDASGNGYFAGNLNVTANVSKGSGSFKIDPPLDPANRYLSHSFVESPDMMNVYNGIVVLDARGSAWVVLPNYFQDLNRDYRYQLTSIGAPGPRLYIAREVSANRFRISGGKPHAKVS